MTIDNSDMPRSRTFSNEEVKQAIRTHPDPFVTTTDLADEIGVRNCTIHKRLVEMVGNGEVCRKKVGASAVVYWLPEQNRAASD